MPDIFPTDILYKVLDTRYQFNWRGTWSASTTYKVGDIVTSGSATYKALEASTGTVPIDGVTWALMSQADGIVDPTRVDAYDASLMGFKSAQISAGTYTADRAVTWSSVTQNGFTSAIQYTGQTFTVVRVYIQIQAAAVVKASIRNKAFTILASTTETVKTSGYVFFVFPVELNSTVIVEDTFYLSVFTVDNTTKLVPPTGTRTGAFANIGTYTDKYHSVGGADPALLSSWGVSSAGWSVLCEFYNPAVDAVNLATVNTSLAGALATQTMQGNRITTIEAVERLSFSFKSSQISAGVFASARANVGDPVVYTGFATAITYLGESFSAVKIYVQLTGTPAYVTVEIRNKAFTVLATADEVYVTASGYVYFYFSQRLTSSLITEDTFYLSMRNTGNTVKIVPPSVTSNNRTANMTTYPCKAMTSSVAWYPLTGVLTWGMLGEFYDIPADLTAIPTANFEALSDNLSLTPEIVLPPKLWAVVGHEINVYFENLSLANARDYNWNVDGGVGSQQNERYTVIPAAAGTTALTFEAYYPRSENLAASAATSLIASAASVGTGVNRKCVFIGDSITDNTSHPAGVGTYTGELLNLFSGAEPMRITLYGTRGTAPDLHEGRGSWVIDTIHNVDSYVGKTNAFRFAGAWNFAQYLSTNSIPALDYVFFNFGINDVIQYTSDALLDASIPAKFTDLDAMIANVRSTNAATKICVCTTIPPASDEDAFGASYGGTGLTQWRAKRNHVRWIKQLIAHYKDREAEKIYLVPIKYNMDPVTGMQYSASPTPVNSRTATTVTRHIDSVHPGNTGYYQIADAIYAFLKGQEV